MPVLLRSVLLLSLMGGMTSSLPAREIATSAETPAARAAGEPMPHVLSPEEKEKRQKAQIALSGVAAIAILGVAGLAGIVLWGGRLRRMLRNSPGPKPLKNELWFLKPEKPPIRSALPERKDTSTGESMGGTP